MFNMFEKKKIVSVEPLSPRTLVDNLNPINNRDVTSITELTTLTPEVGSSVLLSENDLPAMLASRDELQSTAPMEDSSMPSTHAAARTDMTIATLPSIAEEDTAIPTTSTEASIPVRTLSKAETVRSVQGEADAAANIAKFQASVAAARAEEAEVDAAAARALQNERLGEDGDEGEGDSTTNPVQDEDTGAAVATLTTTPAQLGTANTTAALQQNDVESITVSLPHSATGITTLAELQQPLATPTPIQDVLQQTADNGTTYRIPIQVDIPAAEVQVPVILVENVEEGAAGSSLKSASDGTADVVSPTSTVVQTPTTTKQPAARPDMELSQTSTLHANEDDREPADHQPANHQPGNHQTAHSRKGNTFFERVQWCCTTWRPCTEDGC